MNRNRPAFVALTLVSALAAGACSADPETDVDAGSTDASLSDASLDDAGEETGSTDDAAGVDDATIDMPGDTLAATDYCESTSAFFCDYYLRCERTATSTRAECIDVFLETCNSVFEPQYAALANDGRMRLSRSGMEACEAHLGSVSCDEQVFDLDGGCNQMWEGLAEANEPCAPGIGSFVCSAATACVIDLDFCGTCTPAVDVGADCSGPETCVEGARCVNGTCVERGLPGEACSEGAPCVVGATCEAGTCVGPEIVTVGDACDQARRCPYTSTCLDGSCVRDALIGGDCTTTACASGRCVDGTCRAFVPVGEACTAPDQCVSGVCDGGRCAAPVSSCLLADRGHLRSEPSFHESWTSSV